MSRRRRARSAARRGTAARVGRRSRGQAGRARPWKAGSAGPSAYAAASSSRAPIRVRGRTGRRSRRSGRGRREIAAHAASFAFWMNRSIRPASLMPGSGSTPRAVSTAPRPGGAHRLADVSGSSPPASITGAAPRPRASSGPRVVALWREPNGRSSSTGTPGDVLGQFAPTGDDHVHGTSRRATVIGLCQSEPPTWCHTWYPPTTARHGAHAVGDARCAGAGAVGLEVSAARPRPGRADQVGAGGDRGVDVLRAHEAVDLDARHRATPTSSARSSGRRMSDVPTRTASAPARGGVDVGARRDARLGDPRDNGGRVASSASWRSRST